MCGTGSSLRASFVAGSLPDSVTLDIYRGADDEVTVEVPPDFSHVTVMPLPLKRRSYTS